MKALQGDYTAQFRVVPSFHAALHIGAVVTGEMGDIRREIVYLGDTVNTTARIEKACKELGEPILASGELIARLDLPISMAAKSLRRIRLPGKAEEVELYRVVLRETERAAA